MNLNRDKFCRPYTKGFSLLEVILGALICAFAFGGFAAMWVSQERSMRLYRNHNFARFLAVRELENVMAQKYSEFPAYAATTPKSITVTREIDGAETSQSFQVLITLATRTPVYTDIVVRVDNLEDGSPPFEVRTSVFYTL